MANKEQFCEEVGAQAETHGVTDGDDLCFTLIEAGVITPMMGVKEAARLVAQYALQA